MAGIHVVRDLRLVRDAILVVTAHHLCKRVSTVLEPGADGIRGSAQDKTVEWIPNLKGQVTEDLLHRDDFFHAGHLQLGNPDRFTLCDVKCYEDVAGRPSDQGIDLGFKETTE